MNELLVLVETGIGFAWVALWALGVLSMGLLMFDRNPAKDIRGEDAALPRERRAA